MSLQVSLLIFDFQLLKKFLRYNLVGITGTIIYLFSLFIFVQIIHWQPVLSAIISFLLNIICNFILNHRWVFTTHYSKSKALTRFFIVSLWGLVLNAGIMFWVVHILHWPYYYGVLFAILVLPLTNFLLHHYWSFSSKI